MKKLVLLLFMSHIVFYVNSQSLGWTYEKILESDYSIVAYDRDDSEYYTRFYFLYSDQNKTCGLISMKIPAIALNGIITNLNDKYVKLAEMKWKDYVSGIIFEIVEKPGREFFLISSTF
jgi:hypothetical protein